MRRLKLPPPAFSWGKSADGVSEKIKQLDSVLQSQKSKLQAYKDELKRTEQAESENSKRAEELRAAYQSACDQYGKNSDEAKKYKNALNEVEKEQDQNKEAADKLRVTILNQEGAVAKTSKEMGNYSDQLDEMEAAAKKSSTASEQLKQTITDQESKLSELKAKYTDIVLTQGEESDAAKQCAQEIKELSGELNENKSKLTDAEGAADKYSKQLDEVEESAKKSATASEKLEQTISDQESELAALKKQYTDIVLTQGAESDAAKQCAKEIKELSGELSENKSKLSEAESIADKFDKTLDDTKDSAENAGDGFTVLKGALANLLADGIKAALSPVKKLASEIVNLTSKISSAISVSNGISLIKKGFSLLSGSMDSAIERFDTMSQYPKMLQQLGFSIDESEKSTKKLSEGIDGLPTALDDVVATAQNLTILTGNLEKSTDTTIALNNAFLASGSATEDASRGLTQYTQMLSKGKVDAQSWNTLNETMGYALTKTAESFGYAGESAKNDLYAALQSGEITFNDFNDRIIELNEGTGGFAEVAKTASVGVATSFQNIKTAVTKNLANTVTAINDSMTAIGLPGIAASLDSFKDVVNSTMGGMSDAIKLFIGNAGTELQSLYSAFKTGDWETIGESVTGVVGSFIDTINSRLPDIINMGVGLINSFLQGITSGSDDVLNGGLSIYTTLLDGISQIIPNLMPLVGEIISTLAEGFAAKMALVAEIAGELITALVTGIANNLDVLVPAAQNALEKIVSAIIDNLPLIVDAGKKIIVGLLDGLSSAAPSLAPITDTIKGIFVWLIDNKDVVIAAVAGMAAGFAAFKLGSLVTSFVKLFKSIKSGTGIFATLNATMALNPIVLIVAAIAGLIVAFVVLWNKSETFRNFWIGLWDKVKSAAETVVNAIVTFFTQTIPNAFTSAVTAVGNFFTAVVTFFSQLPGNIATFLGNAITSVITWATNLIQKGKDAGSKFVSNVVQFIQNLPYNMGYVLGLAIGKVLNFGIKLLNFAKTEIPKFITNIINFIKQLPGKFATWLTNTINKVTQWGVNLVSTGREKASNFITSVIDFIKQLPGKVQTWFTNTVSEVVTWGTNMAKTGREKATNFVKDVISNVKSLPSKVYNAIKAAVDKVVTWGTNLAAKGTAAATSLYNAVVDGVSSLPAKMVEIGKSIIDGVWSGIVAAKDAFVSKVNSFFQGLYDGVKSLYQVNSPSKLFRDGIGKSIVEGVQVGIIDNATMAYNAVRELAQGTVDAATDELDINSPSRVFKNKIAKNIVKGITTGIGENAATAINTMYKLCKNLVNTAAKANGNYTSVGEKAVKNFEKGYKSMLKTSSSNLQKEIDKVVKKQTDKNKKAYKKAGTEVMEAYEKAMSAAADKIKTTLSNKLTAIAEEAQAKYDEIANLQASMNQKLSSYGDLFTRDDDDNLIVSNLNKDINTLKAYGKNLEALKGKISDDLLSEITEMNVDDAVDFTAALLEMSAKDLEAYNKAYTQKINTAKSVSSKYYKDKVDEIKKEYTDKVTAAFAAAESKLKKAGEDAIEGFITGLTKKSKKANKEVKKIANAITKAMKNALKIKSPSKVFEQIGIFSGEGYEIGFVESLEAAKKSIISALPTDIGGVTGSSMTTNSKVYNFYQTNNSPKALSRLEIYRQTKNQIAFAKGV